MDNNFEVGRAGIPDEHLASGMTPEELNSKLADWNDGYSEEEQYAIDNPAEPTAAEKVADYLSNIDVEGTEFWNYVHGAQTDLMKGDIEGAQAYLRVMVEVLNTLNQQLSEGQGGSPVVSSTKVDPYAKFGLKRNDKTAAAAPLGLEVSGWTLSDYQWAGGPNAAPDHLEYALVEHPTQGWIQVNGIDVGYEGGTVNTYTQNHGGPGLDERMTDIDRGNTQASFASVDYFSPQNDTDVPDGSYTAQDAPSDIIDIVNEYVAEDPTINEILDDHLAQNPPEPDYDSMPGGADW